jgi:hypothetical protein
LSIRFSMDWISCFSVSRDSVVIANLVLKNVASSAWMPPRFVNRDASAMSSMRAYDAEYLLPEANFESTKSLGFRRVSDSENGLRLAGDCGVGAGRFTTLNAKRNGIRALHKTGSLEKRHVRLHGKIPGHRSKPRWMC